MKKLLLISLLICIITNCKSSSNNKGALDWVNKISNKKYSNLSEVKKLNFGHPCFRENVNEDYELKNSDFQYFQYLNNLNFLILTDNNYLYDSDICSLKKVKNLKILYFDSEKVSEKGLDCLSDFKSLEKLSIPFSLAADDKLKYFQKSKKLKNLSFNGPVPTEKEKVNFLKYISKIKNLEELNLSYFPAFKNEEMVELTKLKKLKKLEISISSISDDSIKILCKIPNLKILNIQGNKLSLDKINKLKKSKPDIEINDNL